MDSLCSKLHAEGVGAHKQSAAVISFEDEELLWSTNTISFESPQSFQYMIFYHVGLHFCLHGVQEHHALKVEQLKRHPSDVDKYDESTYYKYTEFISKTNQHRFKDIHMKNKQVKVYAIVGSERCVVNHGTLIHQWE